MECLKISQKYKQTFDLKSSCFLLVCICYSVKKDFMSLHGIYTGQHITMTPRLIQKD